MIFNGVAGKRLAVVAVLALFVVVCGLGLYYILRPLSEVAAEYEAQLDPPDVTSPIGPSNSTLGRFKDAAVVSNGAPCATIGSNILKKGGSAVEAAIATALCDGVACMQNMGVGGGFLMTIYQRKHRKATALIARETAPAAAKEDMFHGSKWAAQLGARSIAIPGELKGYQAAFERFGSGKIKWHELFDPTIKLCEEGVPVNQHLANSIKGVENEIRVSEHLSTMLIKEDGTVPVKGDLIKLPKLAETFKRIAYSKKMADELYDGALTEAFVKDIADAGGLITKKDMNDYKVRWEDPIVAKLNGNLTLYTMPPPGSGALLAFMLQVLDGLIPAADNSNITNYQRITETFKHAYGRRTEFGDPAFVNITGLLHELASPSYINAVRKNISDTSTSQDYRDYGAKFDLKHDHGTANIVVLAPNGDAVSVTSTVNLLFGSSFVSNSTGIILNNEMDDFSAPNITNYFGVPPSPPNFIKAGKRPMSSMAPSVVVNEDGSVRLALGSAGGTKITSSIAFVTMLNLWFGKDIKEAIDEPRIHHQLMPMQLAYEYGVIKHTVEGMINIGHDVVRQNAGSSVTGIANISNIITGNCDYRRGGITHGF